jgi:hypothetical protein
LPSFSNARDEFSDFLYPPRKYCQCAVDVFLLSPFLPPSTSPVPLLLRSKRKRIGKDCVRVWKGKWGGGGGEWRGGGGKKAKAAAGGGSNDVELAKISNEVMNPLSNGKW